MKKVFWAVGSLLISLAAAVLVVPSFINWNEYKGEISDRVKTTTGRHLDILGDIKIGVLPSPAIRAEGVRIANIEGASTTDMVTLERLEVSVALAPLLSGKVQVRSIKLVQPVVNVEVLADGRSNLDFTQSADTGDRDAAVLVPGISMPTDNGIKPRGSAIRIDDLVIEKGTIVYRDARAGQIERVSNLNGRFAAASLSGPMEASGSAVVRGIPLSFDASVGGIVRGRTVPLSADVQIIPGEVKTRLTGTLSGLSDFPRFKGKLNVVGKNLGDFVAGIAKDTVLPTALRRSFGIRAEVQATNKSAQITSIIASLDQTQGTGQVTAVFGDELGVDIDLKINRIDLDEILGPMPTQPPSPVTTTMDQKYGNASGKPKASATLPPRNSVQGSASDSFAALKFSTGVNANLNLVVEALTYRGAPIRQAKLSASLANGEITLSQLSALLPGGSDLAIFGFAIAGPGGPSFDGTVDVSSNDLRGVLKWLDLPVPNVSVERLRKLKFAGKVRASIAEVNVKEIDLRLDNTRVKGTATAVLQGKLAIGVNLFVDQINLDGYLPNSGPGPLAVVTPETGNGVPERSGPVPHLTGPLTSLSPLAAFDANIIAKVQALNFRGLSARNVDVDATLLGGDISIKKLNIENIGGLKIGIAGGINGFAESNGPARPVFKNLQFRLKGKSLTRPAKLLGVKLPVFLARIGAVDLTTRLDGDLKTLRAKTNLKVAGGVFGINGKIMPLAKIPGFDTRILIKHPNLVRLLRLTGVNYHPAKAQLGGIELSGQLKGNLASASIINLKSKIGTLWAAGTLSAELKNARPKITANLKTSLIPIDDFLSTKKRAGLRGKNLQRVIPVTWRSTQRDAFSFLHQIANQVRGRWSTDRLDLSALRLVNADLNLKSDAVIFDKIRVDDLEIVANLDNGVLQTRQLIGRLFGGALTGNARLTEAGQRSQYQTRLKLANMNVSEALRVTGAGTVGSGRMTVALDLKTSGGSVDGIVRRLNGTGSLRLAGLDVRSAGRRSALAPVLDLVSGLNQFAGAFSANRRRGLADVEGSFRMNSGIALFNDLRLTSNVGNGVAQGTVDFPNWRINSKGKIELAQNLIVQLLAQETNAVQILPFSVRGRLDAPTVKLETASLPNRGIPIPKKLLEKKGVGQILQGILRGTVPSAPAQPSSSSPRTKPPPPLDRRQQQNKPRVEDVLKGILRSLGR